MHARIPLAAATLAALGVAACLLLPRAERAPDGTALSARDEPEAGAARPLPPGLLPPPTAGAGRGAVPRPGVRAPAEPSTVRGVVLDESDRPIAGAALVLAAVDPAAVRGIAFADGEVLATAVSDRDGTFALPAPTVALARLTASAEGRATAAAWVDPAGARRTFRLPPEAVLSVEVVDAEGAAVPDAEVEVLVGRVRRTAPTEGGRAEVRGLPEGAARVEARSALRGRGEAGPLPVRAGERSDVLVVLAPSAGLSGRVVEEGTGRPVAGAQVLLARPGRSLAAPPTDAQGRFHLPAAGALGERLQLSVAAEGYLASLETWYVEAPADDRAEHVFALTPAAPWSGRVEDADGQPVGGARVAYTSDGVVGRAPAETLSAADGTFTLPAPPPPAPGRRVVLTASGPQGRAALALRPGTGAPEPLVLRLAAGASVRGRVLDPAGQPLAGVLARLQPAWDEIPDRRGADLLHAVNAQRAGGATALTGSDGVWEIADVPTGAWRLSLERDGVSRRLDTPIRVTTGDEDAGDVTWGGGLALHGRVLAADGRPVPDAVVRVQPGGATVPTDARGEYAVADLEPGTHRLEASVADGSVARTTVELKDADTAADLVLPPPASLAVEVEEGGRAYRGPLRVTLRSASSALGVVRRESLRVSDGRGVLTGLPAGTFRLEAEGTGGLVPAGRALPVVELRPGGTASVKVVLGAAARVVGVLLDAEGRPVAEGRVGLEEREARVDGRGRFAFEGLKPGRYALTAEGRGGAAVGLPVEARAGAAAPLEVRLAPAGALDVRVRDAAGRPVGGALVSVGEARHGTPFLRVGEPRPLRTGPDGRARREDLPAGEVRVRARTADGRTGTANATVEAGRTTAVDVTLASG